jgi:hypothetical protein
MTDLDRRLERENIAQRRRIARLDEILQNPKCRGTRRARILEERNASVIEMHEATRRQRVFDKRFSEACEDPTGQDLDVFLGCD